MHRNGRVRAQVRRRQHISVLRLPRLECNSHCPRMCVSGSTGPLTTVTELMTEAYKEKLVSGSVSCSNNAMGGDPLQAF